MKYQGGGNLTISQPKVINCSLLSDFCLVNFKFLTDLNLKLAENLNINLSINILRKERLKSSFID
jgi:hypothetical protein